MTWLLLFALAVVGLCMWEGRREDIRKGFCEMTVVLMVLTLAQWGQCPGGRCGGGQPSMMFPPIVWQQPTYVPPPPVDRTQPPIVDGFVEGRVNACTVDGDILRIGLIHDDGQAWTYSFPWKDDACCVNNTVQVGAEAKAMAKICTEQKLTARLRLNAAKGNAVESVELYGYTPTIGGKPIAIPDSQKQKKPANVQDGKKGQGCPNPNCACGDGCKCSDCKCSKAAPVGVAIPVSFTQEAGDDVPNYGIDKRHMQERAGRKRYSTNDGREISKKEADKLLKGDGSLPDDSGYDSLTVIGTKDQCKEVQTAVDSNPAFAPLRDKLLVQCYEPTDDMIKDKGFVPGSPSIYLQDNHGKVKARFESNPGPAVLAEEINKRRPDYDPNKDPQPLKPGPTPGPLVNPTLGGLVEWFNKNQALALTLIFMWYLILRKPTPAQPAPAK